MKSKAVTSHDGQVTIPIDARVLFFEEITRLQRQIRTSRRAQTAYTVAMSSGQMYKAFKCPSCHEVTPFGPGVESTPSSIPLYLHRKYTLNCPKCRARSTMLLSDMFDTRFDEDLDPSELEQRSFFVTVIE